MTNDKLREALLPCPFCGGDARLSDGECGIDGMPRHYRDPQCKTCGVSFGYGPPDKAVALWNRRAAYAAPVEAEPFAWCTEFDRGPQGPGLIFTTNVQLADKWRAEGEVTPLYTHPAEQGKDAEDATTEARAENKEPIVIDGIHSAGAYFDWGQNGCGFGQLSFAYKDGKWEFDTECMGPRWTRKCLHAFADHAADQFEQQHSAARNAKPAKGG